MMNNSNLIADNELEEVTGGNVTMGDRVFTGYVDLGSAVVGQNYYILLNDGRNWTYGTLQGCGDRDIFGSKVDLFYRFQLHMINGDHVEVPQKYTARSVTLYKNCYTSSHGKF